MKATDFYRQIGVALLLAVLTGVGSFVVVPVLGLLTFSTMAIPGIVLLYLLFFFKHIRAKTGRVTCLLFWSALTLIIWIVSAPVLVSVVLHLLAVSFIRSVYLYKGVLGSLLDFALSGFSLAAGLWCFYHTGSLFLAVWSLFLTQAFFLAIPGALRRRTVAIPAGSAIDQFNEARRNADAALRQLLKP